MAGRNERRRMERQVAKAEKGKDAPPKIEPEQLVIRSVVVLTEDMVAEFSKLMAGNNKLAGMIHRELVRVHKAGPESRMQLAGVVFNLAEPADMDAAPPSRIIHPSAGAPVPPGLQRRV